MTFRPKAPKAQRAKGGPRVGPFLAPFPPPLQPGQSPDLPGTDVPLRCFLNGQVWELKNLVHNLSHPSGSSDNLALMLYFKRTRDHGRRGPGADSRRQSNADSRLQGQLIQPDPSCIMYYTYYIILCINTGCIISENNTGYSRGTPSGQRSARLEAARTDWDGGDHAPQRDATTGRDARSSD